MSVRKNIPLFLVFLYRQIADNLKNKTLRKLKKFQADKYTKSRKLKNLTSSYTFNEIILKERDFKAAQKTWLDKESKQKRSRMKYFDFLKIRLECQNNLKRKRDELTSLMQMPNDPENDKNVRSKSSAIDELNLDLKDLENKEKLARIEYKRDVDECTRHSNKYQYDMSLIYDQMQSFEVKRLNIFKEILFDVYADVNLSSLNGSSFGQINHIYKKHESYLKQLNPDEDTRWWDLHRGLSCSEMVWPKFEDPLNRFGQKIESVAGSSTHDVRVSYANSPKKVVNQVVDNRISRMEQEKLRAGCRKMIF